MTCELCSAPDAAPHTVLPARSPADTLALCASCRDNVAGATPDPVRLTRLRDTVWSEAVAVQIVSYRLLVRLPGEPWARELVEQVWLDDETLAWAQADPAAQQESAAAKVAVRPVDSNGAALAEGDSVTLIKDLEVKGAGFSAKRGTLVKSIHLTDDAGLVEGRVNGMVIVLKTEFLKRA